MFAEPWHGAFLLGSFGNTAKSRVDTKKMSNSIDLKASFQLAVSQHPLKSVSDAGDGGCLASARFL